MNTRNPIVRRNRPTRRPVIMFPQNEIKRLCVYFYLITEIHTMGIPSYFSYIIKNHSNIIRNQAFHRLVAKTQFDRLYMDCNSIIYDMANQLQSETEMGDEMEFEDRLIESVIGRIREHIALIRPSKLVYIAFDGIAPLAKIDQQRSRRYKSALWNQLNFDHPTMPFAPKENPVRRWDTINITPGMPFMNKLSDRVDAAFSEPVDGVETVIVSTSRERGEGEHKMFIHLRNTVDIEDVIAVYGLDSDLIMLSVLQAYRCKGIHIFRETPDFNRKILPAELQINVNEPLFLDVKQLAASILMEMNTANREAIMDYVFMCFFLGNDFLPPIICLKIRSSGIELMLDVYRRTISRYPNRGLIKDGQIDKNDLCIFLKELSKYEHELLVNEYKRRNVLSERLMRTGTNEEKCKRIGLIYRAQEKAVNVLKPGWEERYEKISESEVLSYVLMLCEVKKYYESGELKGRYVWLNGPLLKCVLSCVSRECMSRERKSCECKSSECMSKECKSCERKSCMSRVSCECEFDEETVLKYVCPPKVKLKMEDHKINWMFKEYYEELVIRPDRNFGKPSAIP